MNKSDDISAIAKSLAKAQESMENPTFDSQGHFNNKFASLKAVRNAVVPVLAEHGISVTQELITAENGGIGCLTHLIHESGQTLTFGPFVMMPEKPGLWGAGSASTYVKRYGLMAVANVVGDEDDDATSAETPDWMIAYKMLLQHWADQGEAYKVNNLIEEIDTEQQQELWNYLKPYPPLRRKIKELRQQVRDEQSAPDPNFIEPTPLKHERAEKEQQRATARKAANA